MTFSSTSLYFYVFKKTFEIDLNIKEPIPDEVRSCFYHGKLVHKSRSVAVMNLCDGLSGSILTEDDHLFIERVHTEDELDRQKLRPKYHQLLNRLE